MTMPLYWNLVHDEKNLTSPKLMRALLEFHEMGNGRACQCLNCIFLRVRLSRSEGEPTVFRIWR